MRRIDIHKRENTAENQQQLDLFRPFLENQAGRVLDIFLQGAALTVIQAGVDHKIGDLRARVRDLRDAGYNITGTREPGSRHKLYRIGRIQ